MPAIPADPTRPAAPIASLARPGGAVDADLLRFLASGEAFGIAGGVAAEETTMSWIFFPGDEVYKLKKPLRRPFLDYRTLKDRARCCRAEVRLNRRLAPDVYLEAVPVTREAHGFALGGGGEVADWLVRMRRLPRARMLDTMLAGGGRPPGLDAALDHLFGFMASSEPVRLPPERYIRTMRRQHRVNEAVFRRCALPGQGEETARVMAAVWKVLEAVPAWLLEPLRTGSVIDGHGDLRPEHLCLTDPPVIIDCIEFSRDLRLLDPFDELSYLALECRLLGAESVADTIVPAFADRQGRRPKPELLAFYTALRATIRARICAAHLLVPRSAASEDWAARAQAYLSAARGAIREIPEAR